MDLLCAFTSLGFVALYGRTGDAGRSLGHEVTGSDANVYPPMSTLLQQQGIELTEGYDASQLDPAPDR